MQYENDEIEINLRELFYVLWNRIILIISATLIGGILLGAYSYYFITPTYRSASQIYIVSGSADSMLSLTDLQIGSSLTKDYIALVKSRPVVEEVIENLDLDMKYSRMAGKVSVSNEEGTRIVRISVVDTDPAMSKKIANEFAKVAKKQIPITMQTSEPTIVERAVQGVRVGPNNMRNAMIGAILGFLLSAGISVVIYILDDSVKSAEDVERYLGINTLAAIPEEGGTDNTEKHKKKGIQRVFSRGVRRVKGGGR